MNATFVERQQSHKKSQCNDPFNNVKTHGTNIVGPFDKKITKWFNGMKEVVEMMMKTKVDDVEDEEEVGDDLSILPQDIWCQEYLQQAAISTLSATTSSTSVTTSNINNSNSNTTNNNNNSTINYNNRYNRITSDSGKESSSSSNTEVNHLCLDTFENFEFDIELLTENKSKDQDKASTGQLLQKQLSADDKHHLNQSTTTNLLDHLIPYDIEEGTDTDTEKQKQQLQMMLDEILFGNTEQQSCSNNNNNNNPLNNNNNNCATLNPNTNSTAMDFNNDNFFGDCNSDDIFNFPPTSQNLNDDNLFSDDFASINSSIEDAVDINHMDNAGIPLMDFDLSQCSYSNNYMHSQSPDVMFPCGSQAMAKPQTLAAALSQEILEAEPHVAPDLIHASTYSNCGVGDDNDNNNALSIPIQVDFIDGHDNLHEETATCSETSTSTLQPMGGGCESPKLFNPSKSERMQEKRSKLHLDTKRRRRMDEISPMDTPGIVNMLDEVKNI
ncbi:rho GTPase-activating protein gacU-like [Stomoxys calcitrans]|uniref:rho GTPase-activating protein gacU-like n=1 Tax=Stomoxys calcitrans TaxID=35570 RepID=UPI0027E37754|nr:rho GTPase-activating protein gacU-like [Stomoxys calcitrans]